MIDLPETVVDDVEPPSVVDVDIVDVEGQIQAVVEAGVVDVVDDSTACLFLLINLKFFSDIISKLNLNFPKLGKKLYYR